MPAMVVPMAKAWPEVGVKGVRPISAAISVRLSKMGVAAAAAKRPTEFSTPDCSDTREMNRR
jgi:hypothetical protein